jgi:hypothetical protein
MAATLAFDPDREVLVLFGGTDNALTGPQYHGDTWEFNGGEWRFMADTGPGAGAPHGSAYDLQDRSVRVYMGDTGLGGTWDWDGAIWRRRSSQYLSISFGASMAYDEHRGVMVLHGGWPTYPNPFWSETWEWTGQSWDLVSTWGPVAQGFESMVYDRQREVCVQLGGGITGAWDGVEWTTLAETVPLDRQADAMAYDSQRNVTVLFGGLRPFPRRIYGDTWELDDKGWRLIAVPGPAPRWGHNMAFDARRGVTVLFGGMTETGLSNETWEWDGEVWTLFQPCYADCDTTTVKGVLDIFDFLCFQNRFATQSPYACNCDTSTGAGVCDIFDFLCFQNRFAAGCP